MTTPETTDKPAQAAARTPQRVFTSDRVIIASGLGLAAFAAFFPWYVFFHQEEFGVKPMNYSDSRNLVSAPGRNVVSVSPLAIVDDDNEPALPSEFDPLFTATVPGVGETSERQAPQSDPLSQPFPRPSNFRLLHVANGRALIEDRGGMYIVRIGSVLPDNSRLATLEKREGNWVIVTSEGKVIDR